MLLVATDIHVARIFPFRYLVVLMVSVVHVCCSLVILFNVFPPLRGCTVFFGVMYSRLPEYIPLKYFNYFCFKCVVYSAIWSHPKLLRSNQEQHPQSLLILGSLGYHDKSFKRFLMPGTGFCYIILYLPEVMHKVCSYTLHLCVCLYIHTYIYILKEVKPLCLLIFSMKIIGQ